MATPVQIDPPSNVGIGLVVARFGSPGADGPDSGTAPDWLAPTGTITFTPGGVTKIRNASATPVPITLVPDPVVAVLDEEGYLCTPQDSTSTNPVPAYRGVWLTSNQSDALNPTSWPWVVSYSLRSPRAKSVKLDMSPMQIDVPVNAGVEGSGVPAVDLTVVGDVDASQPIGIPAANALAAAAQARAEAAEAAALAAAESAADAIAPTDAFVAARVVDPDSETAAALTATYAAIVTETGLGVAADTAKLQAAIDSGGRILLDGSTSTPFTVNQILIKTGAHLDLGGRTLKLANGTNADLITTPDFATLTGGTSQAGEHHWSIVNGILNGNGANQSGTSYTFRVFAHNYRIRQVEINSGRAGNVWSEWGTGGVNMEAQWSNFKVGVPVVGAAANFDWRGPHDSVFTNGDIYGASDKGLVTRGNAAGDQFTNVHVWGENVVGWEVGTPVIATGCVSEGATAQNLLLLANDTVWHGQVFGTLGVNPAEIGVQIGDATHQPTRNLIDIKCQRFSAGATPVVFSNDNSNVIRVTGPLGTAAAFYTGTAHINSLVDLHCVDDPTKGVVRRPSRMVMRAIDGNGFVVGPNGTTNPALQISTNVGSAATGLNITGRPAGSGATLAALSSATDEDLYLDAKGAGEVKLGATSTGKVRSLRPVSVVSTDASALAVGANGATNPALQVGASAASAATGVAIVAAAAGSGASVQAISSGTNEALSVLGKGTGNIKIGLGGWNTGHLQLGTQHLWTDGSGNLRHKNSAPTSDTDGTVIT